ncbi:MAG: hypothetical protein RID07_01420, partial [Lacipirellulaceae bacterium]
RRHPFRVLKVPVGVVAGAQRVDPQPSQELLAARAIPASDRFGGNPASAGPAKAERDPVVPKILAHPTGFEPVTSAFGGQIFWVHLGFRKIINA